MGRATRWLKGLFGIKKDRDQREILTSGDRRDNKRWSFGHSGRCREPNESRLCNNPTTIPPNITAAEAAWIRSFYSESEKEQSKHAIAVAAATAAAADAAVAAAQAAVAVVRLTSQGRGSVFGLGGGGPTHEKGPAATKIQTVFRGYLARKALRALKGLVKLQALVRGYLVRKQAAATFHSMQALIRAQASVRAHKARGRWLLNSDGHFQSHFRARKSIERFDDNRSEQAMSIHSRRLSASFETTTNAIDESPKIVEMDTGRPKSRSRRNGTWMSDSGDDSFGPSHSSPLVNRAPANLSIPDCHHYYDTEWGLTGDECRFSTAQSTPRFANSCGSNAPATPAKSVSADTFLRQYTICPSYMANTQSFRAKLRSQSAPKQRPEPGPKKRLSLNEMMESRNSLSGVRMQRSCSQAQEVINFKNAVMSRLDLVSEPERDRLLHASRMVTSEDNKKNIRRGGIASLVACTAF